MAHHIVYIPMLVPFLQMHFLLLSKETVPHKLDARAASVTSFNEINAFHTQAGLIYSIMLSVFVFDRYYSEKRKQLTERAETPGRSFPSSNSRELYRVY